MDFRIVFSLAGFCTLYYIPSEFLGKHVLECTVNQTYLIGLHFDFTSTFTSVRLDPQDYVIFCTNRHYHPQDFFFLCIFFLIFTSCHFSIALKFDFLNNPLPFKKIRPAFIKTLYTLFYRSYSFMQL